MNAQRKFDFSGADSNHALRFAVAMLLSTTIGVSAVIATSPPPAPREAPFFVTLSPDITAAVDKVLDQLVRENQIPGAVIGISENGRIKLMKGYGLADIEHGVPMTKDSVFVTGSFAKQMTAATILLLAERGRLSIDDPLSKYLPDFPRATEVTLKQLMNHTSGISDDASGQFLFSNAARSKDEIVKIIRDTDPLYEFDPGTKWSYSNSGYILLGAVIEKVAGEDYESVLKKIILDPLGLKSSAFNDISDIVPHRVRGYWIERLTGKLKNAPATSLTGILGGAGGLRTTVEDLIKWEDALFGGKVLSKQSMALMMTPAHLKNGQLPTQTSTGEPLRYRYGLGTVTSEPVAGHEAFGQGGSQPGFNTWVRRVPDTGMTIVILTNKSRQARPIAAKLVPAIVEAQKAAGRRR